jgi:hypothetical protein
MKKIWQWLEGKKTKIGGVLVMAGAVAAVFYGRVAATDGLVLFGAGASIFGYADKANRHQAQLLQALAAVAASKGSVAVLAKDLEPVAIADAVAAAQALEKPPGAWNMTMKTLAFLVMALSVLGVARAQAAYRSDGAAVLNDLKATPGAADAALTKARLCSAGFRTGTVRNVTESQKKRICAEYSRRSGCPGNGYEIDHLISIELGGANSDANLWPQPVDAGGVIGFHTKDKVENALHREVCSGKLSLADAQKCIAVDWYACAEREGILPTEPKKAKSRQEAF